MARGIVGVGFAMAALLFLAAPAHAEGPGPAKNPPLIGDVIVFNDEIVEPVSAPVSTCGGALPVLSSSDTNCKDASRVSDDDA
ncbi:hypothetical protein [Rhizohabitans arisaemae]|uniref:hypothetical protein n=1 Tax=Rhizohabitans arisaemae TaxID=2720610 RepID=UPI0024B1BFBF|nr:hypothetical protein [Rhizohabitans arisaemae]